MKKNKVKRKGLLFILFLGIFAYTSVFISRNIELDMKPSDQSSSPMISTSLCSTKLEEGVQQESGALVYDFKEKDVVNITGDVLGSVQSMCDPATNRVDLVRRICSDNGKALQFSDPYGGEEKGGGTMVDVEQIGEFTLTEVTYPLAFWLGKYTMKDSNRQIRKDDPAYSSNGEQIDPDYQLKTLAPYQAKEMSDALYGTVRKPFEVTGRLEVSDADSIEAPVEDGIYTVTNAEHDPTCGCPKTVSTSDYNVGVSNKVSSFESSDGDIGGFWRQQIPGGDNYWYRDKGECIKTEQMENMEDPGLYTACTTNALVSFFKGLFNSVFGEPKWEGCDGVQPACEEGEDCPSDPNDCVDSRNLVVKMTPIFGEVYYCNNGICANSFLTYSYKATLTPEQAAGKKESSPSLSVSLMYFMSTPCKADITYRNGSKELNVPVKCLWDASPVLFNYRLQAKDKAPKQEDFPQTYEEYWRAVEGAITDSAIKYGL